MTDPLDFEEQPPTKEEEAKHPGRAHQSPVAWLFGRQLVRSLKYTLVYTAFGEKLDPRDWMNPRAYTFAAGGRDVGGGESPASAAEGASAVSCPPPWRAPAAGAGGESGESGEAGDFWFDYLSDTGDGTKAVYSLAYLCMSDLWVKEPGDAPPAPGDSFLEKEERPGLTRLPRGSFLMVGGDTAYHMSDYATLHERFQLPFNWAFQDLRTNLGGRFDETRRPIFGIPGNHDYYDQLDGFRRQFRRTVRPEPVGEPADLGDHRNPQLLVSGFVRCQEASYVALELPHGWWLWGLDTEVGTVDVRQRKFFQKLASEATGLGEDRAPAALDKLIVATCAPTTVFGKFPDRDDEKSSRAFYQLGLPRPFLEPDKLETRADGSPEPTLRPDQCRLDISGDVHHYARYWGPAREGEPRVREHGPDRRPESKENYASVVSGIGGAFHHPSQTYKGEIEEHTLYPSERVSRREVARQVFRFWNLINGGGVWLVGFVLAFVIYSGLTFSQSSREFVHSFAVWERAGLFRQEAVTPTVPVIDQGDTVQQFMAGEWVVPQAPTAGICGDVQRSAPACARGCYPPRYFLGACAVDKPGAYWLGVALALASLALVIVCFALAKLNWLFDDPDKKLVEEMQGMPAETREKARKKEQGAGRKEPGTLRWYEERPFRRVAAFVVPTIVVAFLALLILKPFRPHITPFGNSMMVLVTLIWAAGATALSVRYSEWLFWKSSVRKLSRFDWAVTWVLGVFAVVTLTAGLWVFGQNNRAANLVADIVFALVVLAGFFGLIALGYFKAGEMQDGYVKKIPYGLLGLFHAVLQLASAYMIVRKGALPAGLLALPESTPDTLLLGGAALALGLGRLVVIALIMLAVVAGFGLLGWVLMRDNRRVLLAVTWVAHGVSMLLLPWLTWRAFVAPGGGKFIDHQGLLPGVYNEGWWGLLPAVMAGLLGAVLCCVWLGWYFAVSLAYHGHNNEIAGAARIERFKEFVRVRINRDGLTAYVIAVDYPKRDGKDLKP
ncbi:MAG TPA: hypothetical protein VF508_05110, partial [Pyrinomonadaceae bacterium]